ncbi:cyclin-domain-containing protein [Globomyces pollinis-pini]|nr:cyclin-domain-containing protein [Globomyces pollinis-pini]KAI8893630.1 cyclin-domain-containing protein [Globomyces pollinis-pini]
MFFQKQKDEMIPKKPTNTSKPNKKIIVPRNYHDCSPEILVKLVIDLFNNLLIHNDTLNHITTLSNVTRFHSRSIPNISIHDYLTRIFKYVVVENSVLIILLIYVDRICEALPNFTISSYTAHRFIIAAVTAASKSISDVYSTNAYFAKVGGISLTEINLIELEFCKSLNWRLCCSEATVQQYYLNLANSNSDISLPDTVQFVPYNTLDQYLDYIKQDGKKE